MPLQLIHTSAPHLLDSNAAGYGTVARSENMPRTLCAQLTALSILRDPRRGRATTGPQYSYTLLCNAGEIWHVLTCTQIAGADYSGRMCHIAHHLLLSQDEVRTLHANETRPTPAGMILALQKTGFWQQKWEEAPRYLTEGPTLSRDDLPSAEAQPTWKKLTGHKSNARAFFTPPYERDCLILVSPGTPAADILSLFHESDWLTHSRGWGVSFTTEADEGDSFSETLRMVTAYDSPLVQRAQRTGHPVLKIEQGMGIPLTPEPAISPQSNILHPAPPRQDGELTRTLSRSISYYHYTEEPDWLMYDVRPARTRAPYYISAGVAALAALGLITGYFYLSTEQHTNDIAEEDAGHGSLSTNHVHILTGLLGSPYDHEKAEQVLNELAGITEHTQEDSLLLETVSLIRNASQPGARHAHVVKRLCECARLLGLMDKELVQLYLHEATFNITPEEWQKQFDGQQLTDWLILKQTEPQILGLLENDTKLRNYAPKEQPAQPTILAAANTPTPEQIEQNEQTPPPGRVSLIPTTAVSGMDLPDELEAALSNLPHTISTGAYVVSTFTKGGELQPPQRVDLSPNGFRLCITATDKSNEIALHPEHVEGKPCPVPPSVFTMRKGRLHQIESGGQEAIIAFPVPTRKDFHANVILATSFGFPIPKGESITLPPAAKANLEVTQDSFELEVASGSTNSPRLKLKKTKKFPWVLSRQEQKRIRFTVNLPVLAGHNTMQQTGSNLSTYQWTDADISRETDSMTTLRCVVTHCSSLPERLEQAFDRVANSPCCGEIKNQKNASLTLARLYHICNALANDKLTREQKKQLHQDYFALFASKSFNAILVRILAQDTFLHISPEEASADNQKSRKARNNIIKYLNDRQVRDLIRQRIREVLTRSLYAAYTQEQQDLASKADAPPVLILKNISIGSHVELLWQFQMQEN
ncbi:MAG: hypothetical protein IKW48_00500 [Akkermansia sp.]|nr:hypothetical protein [Akkermansia sp.]